MGVLRLLLALAVAGGHAASFFGFAALWIYPGGYAVQIFYIISGFLMALILNEKYENTPRGNWTFYTNRFAKIFGPYFAILAVTIAISLLSKALTGNALLLTAWFSEAGAMTFSTWAFALLTNIFILGQDWAISVLTYRSGSLLFSLDAYSNPPLASQFSIIAPAWTISIELMFYLIAPFILRRHVLLIAALAYASYWFRFYAYHMGYYYPVTINRFFPFELSLFLYGSLSFRIGRMLPTNYKLSAAITAAVAALIVIAPKYYIAHPHRLFFLIGVLLPALFDFSRRNKWDQALGDLSYPLYMVHWPIIVCAAAVVGTFQPGAIGTEAAYPIFVVMIAIAASVLVNRYVVRPTDVWRQMRVNRKPAAVPTMSLAS
jgi:peptidoglycan/LPS O-acetylase OafA/YrhL